MNLPFCFQMKIARCAHTHCSRLRHSVVASFDPSFLTTDTSFPRKRESSFYAAHSRRIAEWIPAFAGMTCGWGLHIAQMTPPPAIRHPSTGARKPAIIAAFRVYGINAIGGANEANQDLYRIWIGVVPVVECLQGR
jgi:hypothetical protein